MHPFDNMYPADFIAEGVDQTRGWFYTLHAIAVMAFDSISYKNVVSNGLVLDKNGQKMSKRLGNAADPFETIAKYGADATRWYMISNAAPWDNLKFDVEGIAEVQRKFFGTLFNTYNFFALYANVDGWKMDEFNVMPYDQRTELDRWIISKLYSLVADYHAAMDDYEPHRACRLVEDFVDAHLSNWYVRLSRRRFWRGEMSNDKEAAYQTLFECLMVVGQLSVAVAPFFSDWLYRNLTAPIRDIAKQKNTPLRHDSVHLTDLGLPEPGKIDLALERRMDYAQRICSLAFSIRKGNGLRVRLPLQKLLLPVLDESFIKEVDGVKDLILSEINVKQIEYITDASWTFEKTGESQFQNPWRQTRQGYESCRRAHCHFWQRRNQCPRKGWEYAHGHQRNGLRHHARRPHRHHGRPAGLESGFGWTAHRRVRCHPDAGIRSGGHRPRPREPHPELAQGEEFQRDRPDQCAH